MNLVQMFLNKRRLATVCGDPLTFHLAHHHNFNLCKTLFYCEISSTWIVLPTSCSSFQINQFLHCTEPPGRDFKMIAHTTQWSLLQNILFGYNSTPSGTITLNITTNVQPNCHVNIVASFKFKFAFKPQFPANYSFVTVISYGLH